MSINNKTIGETIARLRLERNMTQQQLSSVIGVSHQAVSKWENGAALPDLEALLKLSRLFGVSGSEAFYAFDFQNWQQHTNANVQFLVLLACLVAGAALLIAGLCRTRKTEKK